MTKSEKIIAFMREQVGSRIRFKMRHKGVID